ncbi:MAG: ribonuclease P protein component [Cellvibrionales bacterium]
MRDLTFSRQYRLANSTDFSLVFEANQFKVAHPNYLILARYNHYRHARLGLVVSKKNIPTAIARNRIKRSIRESFRLHPSLCAVDAVFLVRGGIRSLSPIEINLLLQRSWVRLSQKCNHRKEAIDAVVTDLTD